MCLKEFPEAKLVRCFCEGSSPFGGDGYTEWEPLKVQREPQREPRPARALRNTELGCEFPFYDQVNKK
jgi:hypothetical protein